MTESLTKITLSGNSKIQFHQHAEKMEFLDSNPDTFKPGLPYTGYVSTGAFQKQFSGGKTPCTYKTVSLWYPRWFLNVLLTNRNNIKLVAFVRIEFIITWTH